VSNRVLVISVPSIARYTALWLLAMAVVLWTPWWREADWRVFGLLNKSNTPSWPQQWVIVDVPYEDADGDPTVFRREISDVLAAIRERQRPRMVILDVYFSSDPRGLDVLQGSLRQLRDARIPVFAAINPVDQSGNPTAQFMSSHAAPIYQQQLDGFGHTQFEFGGTTLKYEPFLALSSALAVPALAVVVAEQQFARPVTSENTSLIVNVGKPAVAVEHTVRAFRAVDGSINFRGAKGSVDLTGTNVLIGSLDKDRSPFANRSGPELLAWALIERTTTVDAAVAQRPLTSDWIMVALATVVPLASVLAFLRLRRLPRRQTLTLWVPALGAVVLGLTLVAMWVGLTYALGYLYPRVTLVAIGVMLAVALAWLSARQAALRSAVEMQVDGQREVLAPQYDFFISYSRTPDNARWVAKNVYEPLRSARDASGRPLRVFFDTEDIKAGASWYATLVTAINSSRHFVAVYSKDYFSKGFCRFEMERAAIRRVNQNDFIIPVLRETVQVPAEFDHIQFVDARDDRDFIDKVLAQANASPPAEADPLQR